jgi:peptide chain release factor 2
LEISKRLDDLQVLIELGSEEEDDKVENEVIKELGEIEKEIHSLELLTFLSGKHDRSNAILSIHPGAGGTESCDWAGMLLRMYSRWAKAKGYNVQILDLLPGDEAGVKSATLLMEGEYAYGYLKAEQGVHRLVRISPFDASSRRHTSFVSVWVIPEVEEIGEVEIREEDLRVETFRAGGPGGQHVNVTDSAVRITHLPTKIVVQCQSDRSQHKNKANALRVLRSRLYEHYRREREKEIASLGGEKKEIGWGSQIRSYIFHPYTLVKDHRTGIEVSDGKRVLDGELDLFIEGYLLRGRREG